ncbi:MAG: heat-inducible transcriptional repressor HrcA [Bacillota bacterium]|nr:heat-inducible transcriptional repressor HrcA [Bacillota bacterium]
MDERKKQVLNAIIKDYIANAEPVGSRAVAKKYDLGVSPATIRNEMSDLEEEGYIEQPHTSAGRVPSDKGYRYYVDNLMSPEKLTHAEKAQIKEALVSHLNELSEMDEFMRSACNMISRLTNYPALATMSAEGSGTLENIQLVQIREDKVLAVLLASTGLLRHKLIDLPHSVTPQQVAQIENKLRRHLLGIDISRVSYNYLRDIMADLELQERSLRQAMEMLEQARTQQTGQKVFTGGMRRMLAQPEFRDVDKLRSVFDFLEQEAQVKKLLDLGGGQHITVAIGEELDMRGVDDCSMVVANYFVGGKKAGTVGVIGPTRMSYDKTVSLMEYIAAEMSRAIEDKNK